MKKTLVTLVALLTLLFLMTACAGNLVIPGTQPTADTPSGQSDAPTTVPTDAPTTVPTAAPTDTPTAVPTTAPATGLTTAPIEAPTDDAQPMLPTGEGMAPTTAPIEAPTDDAQPMLPTAEAMAPTASRPNDPPVDEGDKQTDGKVDLPKEPVDEDVFKAIQAFLSGMGDITLTPDMLKDAIPTYDELMSLLLPAEGLEGYFENVKAALDNVKCEVGDIQLSVDGTPSALFGGTSKVNYIGLKDGQLVVLGDELVDDTWVPTYVYITYTDGSIYVVSAIDEAVEHFQLPVEDSTLLAAFADVEPMIRDYYNMIASLLEEAIDSFSALPCDVQLPPLTPEDLEAVQGKPNTYRLTKAYIISVIDALNAKTDLDSNGIIVGILSEDESMMLKALLSFGDAYPYFVVDNEVSAVGVYAEANVATILGSPEGKPSYIDISYGGGAFSLLASIDVPKTLSLFADVQKKEQDFSFRMNVNAPSILDMKLDVITRVVCEENGMPTIESKIDLDATYGNLDAVLGQNNTGGFNTSPSPSKGSSSLATAKPQYAKEENGKILVEGGDGYTHTFVGKDNIGDHIIVVPEGTPMPFSLQLRLTQRLDLSKLTEANAEIFACHGNVTLTVPGGIMSTLGGEGVTTTKNIRLTIKTEEVGVYALEYRQDEDQSSTTFSLRFVPGSAENFPEISDDVLSYVEKMKNDPTLGLISFDDLLPPLSQPTPPDFEGENGEKDPNKEHTQEGGATPPPINSEQGEMGEKNDAHENGPVHTDKNDAHENGHVHTDKNDVSVNAPIHSEDEGKDPSK